ncbi:MAG: hypothetical protein ACYDCO_25790 [Armatimonadota bacterium]
MKTFRFLLFLLIIGMCRHALAADPPVIAALRARLPGLRQQIPALTKAAEAAAAQQLAHPEIVIRYAYSKPGQQAFTDEFIARSGSLANWQTWPAKQAAPTPDLFICAVRSWEEDATEVRALLAESQTRGYTVILIGPAQGKPGDLPPHAVFFDNGAPDGSAKETGINQMANITLGWMWQCEFAAALSRQGKRPGILISVMLPGAREANAAITPRNSLFPCDTPAPAGVLADAYLARIDWLLGNVAGKHVQDQIARAADLVTVHLNGGKRVVLGCMGHCTPMELGHAVKSPFTVMSVLREKEVREKLQPDDLVVFFSYVGLSIPGYDYTTWFKEADRRVIASFTPDEANPDNNAPFAVARIDQSWKIGDAEVTIPFPPGKMAPMSVINQLLLFRLLDDAVAERVAKAEKP